MVTKSVLESNLRSLPNCLNVGRWKGLLPGGGSNIEGRSKGEGYDLSSWALVDNKTIVCSTNNERMLFDWILKHFSHNSKQNQTVMLIYDTRSSQCV